MEITVKLLRTINEQYSDNHFKKNEVALLLKGASRYNDKKDLLISLDKKRTSEGCIEGLHYELFEITPAYETLYGKPTDKT